jgi:hypothetical protein
LATVDLAAIRFGWIVVVTFGVAFSTLIVAAALLLAPVVAVPR